MKIKNWNPQSEPNGLEAMPNFEKIRKGSRGGFGEKKGGSWNDILGNHYGNLKHYKAIKKFYRKLLNKERLYNLHHADGEEAEIGGKAKALARTVTYKHIEVLSVEDEMSLREKLKGTGIDERRLPGIIARMPLSAKMAYRERKGDFTLLSCPRTVLVEVIPDDKSPHGKMFLWKKKLQENLGYRYINPDGSEGGWVSVFCSLHQNGKEIFIDKGSKVFGKCVLEGEVFLENAILLGNTRVSDSWLSTVEAEDCTFSSAGLAYAKAYSSIFDTLKATNCGVVLSHLLGVGQEDMENRLIFKDNAVEGTFRYSYDLLGISEIFYPRGDRHGKSGVDFYNLGPISEKIRWEPL